MEQNKTPCKGCYVRHTACHDHCAKYAEWKAEMHKQKAVEKERKQRNREDFLRSEECKSPRISWKVGRKYGRK